MVTRFDTVGIYKKYCYALSRCTDWWHTYSRQFDSKSQVPRDGSRANIFTVNINCIDVSISYSVSDCLQQCMVLSTVKDQSDSRRYFLGFSRRVEIPIYIFARFIQLKCENLLSSTSIRARRAICSHTEQHCNNSVMQKQQLRFFVRSLTVDIQPFSIVKI